ncbi:SDR family oxidoreductase [Amycolatopsis cynarae]|uniref:SDR family oxidoreductase n=1 Tax=Amycolatopsis cynarae TaxID=2995223 RepID=A0ABY7AXK9_9PSEU|nr:SDR family oxidoreductase [Amycolatopsis sp. HUAS 11-8]WAL63748.1 SDR family oxidoreductase [Amycolatopsis sp. HUAS 11-8]
MSPRTALITGGTSGIGRASAEALHRRGYQVIVTGQNPDTLAVARKELPEDIVVVRADSRSLADTDRVVEEIRDRFGGLDVLFLNAGIVRALPVEAVDEATFDGLFDVNFKGQFFTLQKALPLLREGGSVLFTIGLGAIRGVPGGSLASASKGALLSMVPTLALELAPRKIRVNAVSPGAVRTGIWDKHGLPPEALEAIADGIPLGRFGTSEEIAETVAFLASDAAAFITGENIVIGGGSGLRS